MQSTSSFTRSPSPARIAAAVITATVLAAVASLMGAPTALADNVWNVDCSVPDLVTAVQQADTAGSGTIDLAPGCTYTFTAPVAGSVDALPAIDGLTGPLTINGNGATLARSRAAGTPEFRLIQVGASAGTGTLDVTIDDLTITGGYVPDADVGGGGIQQLVPGLTLQDDTISDNSAPTCGGGVESTEGGLTMSDSTVTGNTQRSDANPNTALCGGGVAGGGGGLLVAGSTRITDSTIADNTANFSGGGIYVQGANGGHTGGPNDPAIILLQNDTIVDNVGVATTGLRDGGGGIWSVSDVRLVNDTVAGNAPTQLAQSGADSSTASSYFLQGSILVGSCHLLNSGVLLSQGANVFIVNYTCPAENLSQVPRVDGCPPAGCPPDVTSAATADLGPLAGNGGPTQTEAIAASSPAIGLEPAGNCPATDQRGAVRPLASAGDCDAGAYEIQTISTAVSYTGPASGTVDTPVTVSASLTHPGAAVGLPTPSAGGGVPGQPLTITVGAESCTATTDASGVGRCQLTPRDAPNGGPYPVTVRFAGGPDGVGSDVLAASAGTGHTFAVTAAITTSPPGGSTGGAGSSPGSGQAGSRARIAIIGRRVVVRHGRASIEMRCRGPRGAVCRGTVTLTVRIHRRAHGRHAPGRTRTVVVARGRFRLTAGRRRSIAVVVDRRGRELIARARRHRIVATAGAVPAGRRSTAAHRRIVLERAPARRAATRIRGGRGA